MSKAKKRIGEEPVQSAGRRGNQPRRDSPEIPERSNSYNPTNRRWRFGRRTDEQPPSEGASELFLPLEPTQIEPEEDEATTRGGKQGEGDPRES